MSIRTFTTRSFSLPLIPAILFFSLFLIVSLSRLHHYVVTRYSQRKQHLNSDQHPDNLILQADLPHPRGRSLVALRFACRIDPHRSLRFSCSSGELHLDSAHPLSPRNAISLSDHPVWLSSNVPLSVTSRIFYAYKPTCPMIQRSGSYSS